MPAARAVVLNVPLPEASRTAFPSPVVNSLKATAPEGVKPSPAWLALTITVKVTACPYTEGSGLVVKVVVSAARVSGRKVQRSGPWVRSVAWKNRVPFTFVRYLGYEPA